MIIFLDLSNQIIEGELNFAFYDTVSGFILPFDDKQVFDSVIDFIESAKPFYDINGDYIKILLSLIPDMFILNDCVEFKDNILVIGS